MKQAIDILNSNEEYFNDLIEIQKIIYEDFSYDDVISFITKKNILTNKEQFLHLLQAIKKCIFIRPQKYDLLLSVLTYLKDSIKQQKVKFRWMGNHIPPFFLDELSKMGLFNLPIRRLKKENEDQFNNLVEIIKSDDVTSFQENLSRTNININTKVDKNFYKIDRTYEPSLLEITCFYGSLNIFKFLMMNNATRTRMLPNYALAGGNYEIIHILERENVKFDTIEIILEAIKFQRNDVVEYLDPDPFDAFKYSIKYDNIECFVRYLNRLSNDKKILSLFDDVFLKFCFHSVKKNFSEITKILCFLYPDCVNQQDFSYHYMIHRAIDYDFIEISKFLCSFEFSDLNVTNSEIQTPLFVAVRKKNIEIVQILCDNEKVDLNIKDFNGNTAFHIALNDSSIEIIKIFIKNKYRINTTIKNNQELSYMHFAIMTKNLDIVKMINDLDEKLRLIGNKTNTTPLIYSVSYGTQEIVKYLSSFDDVDVNSKNSNGISSLHLAIEKPEILSILCHLQKIDLNIRNDQGNSPLHLAASRGKIDSVKILIGFSDVDINAVNDFNNTPLFLAAENGFLEIVKLLIDQKSINTNIKNKAGIFF